MIELKEKIALVTGGNRGIGKSIVLALAKAGASVCFTNRDQESAQKLEKQIQEYGVECLSYQGNIAEKEHCDNAVSKIIEQFGKIDILINNAGITKDNLILRMKQEDWNTVIDTNLTGVFTMTKAVVKYMMKARTGKIINISSVVGFTGNPGQVNYSATKAGIIGFTKSLAKELGTRNITCNAIAPGFIETDMTKQLSESQRTALSDLIPLGKMGTSQDIANGVLFLSSPLANYITGTTLHINGGMY